MSPVIKVEITPKTIIFVALFILFSLLAIQILDIIILFFIAILFASAINPLVDRLHLLRIPRPLSILFVYIAVLTFIGATFWAIVPQLINQFINLINQIALPEWLTKELLTNLNLQDLQVITNQLNTLPKIFDFIFSAFSSLVAFFSLLVVSFYLLIERPKLHHYLTWIFPDKKAEKKAEIFISQLETQIGGWVRGETFLMLIVGILTYIGLLGLGINYALPLAIIAGLLELLPNLGPTLAAIPALIVAYLSSPNYFWVFVLALYIAIQQVENNFIVPYIMRRVVGLNPVVTMFLLLVGFRLGGVAGAVLAIPIFLVLKVTVTGLYQLKRS